MNTESLALLQTVLGWSAVINLAVLLWWFALFALARDWLHRLHGRWFELSRERFDALHYGGMALYKLAIVLFNLVPYLALRISV